MATTESATRLERHVVIVLLGGLGNQLFQFCAGESIQRRTGLPVLYDCELGYRADPFGRRFELPHLIVPARRAPSPTGKRKLRSRLVELIELVVERQFMRRFGISSLPLEATLWMARWWPGSEVVCRSYFQLLEFVDPETVEELRAAMRLTRDVASSEVAVHFRAARDRLATGAQLRNLSATVLGLDYYRECLRQIRAAMGPVRFRVFSDVRIIPENVFQPDDEVILDTPAPNETPWDTLARMARCRHFVIANSSFSWWAAFLGRAADKRVYAPAKWLFENASRSQRGIFPPEWHRVESREESR